MSVSARDSAPVEATAAVSPGDPGQIVEAAGILRRFAMRRTHLMIVGITLLAFASAYVLAYLLRFDFSVPFWYPEFILYSLPFVLLIKLVVFYGNGIYRILWAYLGIMDLFRILRAAAIASLVLTIANRALLPNALIPRSVLVVDGVLTFLSIGGLYAILRSLREARTRGEIPNGAADPVFIVGAGDAGETLLRELQRNPSSRARVVGFLDDAPEKRGRVLRGVPVLGRIDEVERLAAERGVRKSYIAIPSADGSALRHMVGPLLKARLNIKVLPPVAKLAGRDGFLPHLRDVSIEDLLRREPIRLDDAAISRFIEGRVVLVTGAAGSIGSELCRQILDYHPARVVALDWAETPLHTLMLELGSPGEGGRVAFELADITDRTRMARIFALHKPQVVFHAAALKHVPMLEEHPREAVRVNVLGTKIVSEEARREGAEAFVMVSTDKAVGPRSVMGATKRIAELLVEDMNEAAGGTRFVSVRFGNVLGSQGSVLAIFKSQLARGGPITITHPDMKRYFMTIPEAVQLVLQASVIGSAGGIFVLDMGEPLRIVELAEDLVRLSGLTPGVDVKLEFTGIRPGEKLFEELHRSSEHVHPTSHAQVLLLREDRPNRFDHVALEGLLRMSQDEDSRGAVRASLTTFLPEFSPDGPEVGREGAGPKNDPSVHAP